MRRAWQVGDYLQNIESGWVGVVVARNAPEPGFYELIGVDLLALVVSDSVLGALCPEDRQWFAGEDLKRWRDRPR
jgi:hypothetical protein